MRKQIARAAAAAMLISAMPLAAQAFPVASAPKTDAAVTLVAGGCGIAFHRGPFGGCRPNRVFVVRRPIVCRIVGLIPHRVCRRF